MTMKEHPASSTVSSRRNHARFCVVVASCAAITASGCSMQNNKPKIPWHTAVLVRPIPPAKPAPSSADAAPLPDLKMEFPPQSIRFATSLVPARPHVAPTAHSPGSNEAAAKPEQPSITPQLPPAEALALQQQMDKSASAAERNLASTNGKSLNAAQLDLASKVRSFLADSREAAKEGDLRRANNLAKKAQVLSEELAASL
jgi:hypothetical protein